MHDIAPRFVETIADRAMQIVGGLALTLAFMSSAPADAAATHAKHEKLDGIKLVQPDQLRGHKIGITARAASLLAGASVKVYETPIEEEPGYPVGAPEPWCSGVNVGVGDNTYISLAAHCFEDETLSDDGMLDPLDFPLNGGALDFFNRARYTYAIQDPALPPADQQTLATADGIDIDTDVNDVALMKMFPSPPVTGKTGHTPPGYQQLGALPYMRQANLTPGQKVALYSAPESTDNVPVKAIGTYIGVYDQPTGYASPDISATRPVDVVLIHPKQPYQDPCYYGASGSSFVALETRHGSTAGLGGKIAVSGPLSIRSNSRYDPYLHPTNYNPNPEVALKQSLITENNWRTAVERQLHVAISPEDTICKYSIADDNTKNALINAFGNFAPQLPLKGGGNAGDIGGKG